MPPIYIIQGIKIQMPLSTPDEQFWQEQLSHEILFSFQDGLVSKIVTVNCYFQKSSSIL